MYPFAHLKTDGVIPYSVAVLFTQSSGSEVNNHFSELKNHLAFRDASVSVEEHKCKSFKKKCSNQKRFVLLSLGAR